MSRSYRAPYLVRLISFLVPRLKSAPMRPGSPVPDLQAKWDEEVSQLRKALHAASSPEHSGAFDLSHRGELGSHIKPDHRNPTIGEQGRENKGAVLGAMYGERPATFGKRETPPAKRPRLGPMPHYFPDALRDGHTVDRAKKEGWKTLAILDGHQWAKRCQELDENIQIARNMVGVACTQRDEALERVEILDSKRQDQEQHITLLTNKFAALELTADHFDNRAKEWEARAETVLAAVEFCLDLEATNAGDAVVWLKDWTEGDTVAEEELQNWRNANAKRTAELPGTAVSDGNGLQPVPPVVGCERPEPPAVRSAARHYPDPDAAYFEIYRPAPRTADMAAVVEATGRHTVSRCVYEAVVEEGAIRKCARVDVGPRCSTCPDA